MAYVGTMTLGPNPVTITCPKCQNNVTTIIGVEPICKTHLLCILLCCCGCYLCAPCVYCSDSCVNKWHICPNCQHRIGVHKP